MKRCVALFTLLASLFFALPAFSNKEAHKTVATIKPLHSLVSMATENLQDVPPKLLLHGHSDPHHLSLRPSQAKMLEEADTVFFASEHIETFLKNYVEKTPLKFFPPIAFNEKDKYKYSHAWLDMKLTLKMLKSIFYYYRTQAGATLETVKSDATTRIPQPIMDKFIERSNHYLTQLKPYKERTIWFDSLVAVPLVEQFALKGELFKHMPKDVKPSCLVVTHGKNTRMQHASKKYGHRLIHMDLLGADIPEGSAHYFTLMDRLVQQISDCLT